MLEVNGTKFSPRPYSEEWHDIRTAFIRGELVVVSETHECCELGGSRRPMTEEEIFERKIQAEARAIVDEIAPGIN